MYTIDTGRSLKYPIVVYDSKMANLGGKLLILIGNNPWPIFHYGRQDVWCVEIALERHGDETFGRVESTMLVLTSQKWPSIELSRTLTI